MTVVALALLLAVFDSGVAVVAALLAWEHSLVHADDLSRIDQAFFTVNGVVGFVVLAAAIAEVGLRR